jgi:hypothetical protein
MKKTILLLILLLSNFVVVSQTNLDSRSNEAKIWTKIFGVSDESAELIAKSAKESGSDFNLLLIQIFGGEGTYDDLVSYVSRQGGSFKSVDDIVNFVISQPELLKKIATSSDIIMKNAAQEIIKNSQITTLLEKDLIDEVEGLLLFKLNRNNSQSIIDGIDDSIKILNRYSHNLDVNELIRKLKDRKLIAENMKSASLITID